MKGPTMSLSGGSPRVMNATRTAPVGDRVGRGLPPGRAAGRRGGPRGGGGRGRAIGLAVDGADVLAQDQTPVLDGADLDDEEDEAVALALDAAFEAVPSLRVTLSAAKSGAGRTKVAAAIARASAAMGTGSRRGLSETGVSFGHSPGRGGAEGRVGAGCSAGGGVEPLELHAEFGDADVDLGALRAVGIEDLFELAERAADLLEEADLFADDAARVAVGAAAIVECGDVAHGATEALFGAVDAGGPVAEDALGLDVDLLVVATEAELEDEVVERVGGASGDVEWARWR